jgi:hypothetical protein
MQSLKSLLAGFFYIIILGLVIQLIFMFLAMGYTELTKVYPWVSGFGGYIGYTVGLIVYFLLMTSGGIITATLAKKNVLVHCFIVGVSTTTLSVFSSQNNDDLNYLSLVFVVLGIAFTIAGGVYWKNNYQTATNSISFQ